MIRNYIISAIRIYVRRFTYSTINSIGLSLAIASSLVVLMVVHYEKSYDSYFNDLDQLYRVTYSRESADGEGVHFASASPNVGPVLKKNFPEVIDFGRAFKLEGVLSINDIFVKKENMYWAEDGFINIISLTFSERTSDSLLNKPNSIIISEKLANELFGDESALHKTLKLDGNDLFKITGVFKDIPKNTHLQADAFLPFVQFEKQLSSRVQFGWIYSGFYTYVKLGKGIDYNALNTKIEGFISEELSEFMEYYKLKIHYTLKPVKDIHLHSHLMHELGQNKDANTVRFLNIIAWFILIIAWINFINLQNINTLKRIPEITLRKVLGGHKNQLFAQFLLEALIMNMLILLLGFVLLELFLPSISVITQVSSEYNMWNQSWFWKMVVFIFLVGSLCMGILPAWSILNKKLGKHVDRSFSNSKPMVWLRELLVVIQFIMAIALISGTLSVNNQLNYLHASETGICKDNVLIMPTPRIGNEGMLKKRELFKQELSKTSGIEFVSFSSVIPGKHNMFNRGGIRREDQEDTEGKNYRVTEIDYNYLKVYKNTLLAGRNFDPLMKSDSAAVIINETASRQLGFKTPDSAIGKRIVMRNQLMTVIGVIQDFHQESPISAFEPQIFRLAILYNGYFSVKYNPMQDVNNLIQQSQVLYTKTFPENPFDYFFLTDFYARQYDSQRRFSKVFSLFSLLAILITSIGILSLSAYTVSLKRKEIGIRKALGANMANVLYMLIKKYILLVCVAFVSVTPFTYIALSKWLDNFANKMEVPFYLFVAPFIMVFVLSILMVIVQSLKSVRENPVNSLRYE